MTLPDTDAAAGTEADLVEVGHIGAAHGILGWVKINSDTEPAANILHYTPWKLQVKGGVHEVRVEARRVNRQGLIAKLVGIDDRDAAQALTGTVILVSKSRFAKLPEGEYYWTQLIGLSVVGLKGERFGTVKGLLETGAHDVLVIAGEGEKETLIPYVPGRYVMRVDIDASMIEVDWNLED